MRLLGRGSASSRGSWPSSHCGKLTPSLLSLSAFRTQLELDVARAQRYERPLTVALLDIDRFRQLNLEHGYAAGDAVLAAVGGLIAGEIARSRPRLPDRRRRVRAPLPETGAAAARQPSSGSCSSSRTSRRARSAASRPRSASPALEIRAEPESVLAAARTALEQARAGGGRKAVLFGGSSENGDAAHEPGHGDVIAALASALQERDRYTGDHSESVVDLTAQGRRGLGARRRGDQPRPHRGAPSRHRQGRRARRDPAQARPADEREWELMRQHPVIGERILRAIPGLGGRRADRPPRARALGRRRAIRTGSPVPAIPLGSRIILACDAYHAMTSDRPYRKAMPHDEAMAELTRNAGHPVRPRRRRRRWSATCSAAGRRASPRSDLVDDAARQRAGPYLERPRRPRASPRPTPAASRSASRPL